MTVTSVSFVNTTENMALEKTQRKMVVSFSNNTDRVMTHQQALNMIAGSTKQQSEAAQMTTLGNGIKGAMDTLIAAE